MDKEQLKRHILDSDLTAMEKRYLEELVDAQYKADGRRLIDADALKETELDFDTDDDCTLFCDAIDNAPTIEVEPVRHGRCISDIYGMTCSECGCNLYMSRINFCHNCGAKMDKEE